MSRIKRKSGSDVLSKEVSSLKYKLHCNGMKVLRASEVFLFIMEQEKCLTALWTGFPLKNKGNISL